MVFANIKRGLYFASPDSDEVKHCDLLAVRVRATVRDCTCLVAIEQEYENKHETKEHARYTFPVPATASVDAFAMLKQDGTKVVGIVQERADALVTHEAAKSAGKLTALAAQHTRDVFELDVGNIPPNSTVTIQISYVTLLRPDERHDALRLALPTTISTRYGPEPAGQGFSFSRSAADENTFLWIDVFVESITPVTKVSCPTHPISVGFDSIHADGEVDTRTVHVSLTQPNPLYRNFVLAFSSAGLNDPRCIAEYHPLLKSWALCATLVPRFTLPPSAPKLEQEFIFLLDRSASMDGRRLSLAKSALRVMLKSLPKRGSRIGLIGFGSTLETLWEGTKEYSQASLDTAIAYVAAQAADLGGTDILSAIRLAFSARHSRTLPTSIFLLTDGDAWNARQLLQETGKLLKEADGKVRLFCLAIGESSSTEICEGLARLGNGVAYSVSDNEPLTGKTARLLRAATSPPVSDVCIDWGITLPSPILSDKEDSTDDVQKDEYAGLETDDEKIALFEKKLAAAASAYTLPQVDEEFEHPATPVVLAPFESFLTAPAALGQLYSGSKTEAFAVWTPTAEQSEPPKAVLLRGRVAATGLELEQEIKVEVRRGNRDPDHPQLLCPVHILAASKIIEQLEDEYLLAPFTVFDESRPARVLRAKVARVGTTYCIASSQTSFVAVDESEAEAARETKLPSLHHRAPAPLASTTTHQPSGGLFSLPPASLPPPQPAPQGFLGPSAANPKSIFTFPAGSTAGPSSTPFAPSASADKSAIPADAIASTAGLFAPLPSLPTGAAATTSASGLFFGAPTAGHVPPPAVPLPSFFKTSPSLPPAPSLFGASSSGLVGFATPAFASGAPFSFASKTVTAALPPTTPTTEPLGVGMGETSTLHEAGSSVPPSSKSTLSAATSSATSLFGKPLPTSQPFATPFLFVPPAAKVVDPPPDGWATSVVPTINVSTANDQVVHDYVAQLQRFDGSFEYEANTFKTLWSLLAPVLPPRHSKEPPLDTFLQHLGLDQKEEDLRTATTLLALKVLSKRLASLESTWREIRQKALESVEGDVEALLKKLDDYWT